MMTTAVETNMLRKKNKLPLLRFDLRRLSEQDILDLRHAYEGMYEISEAQIGDRRGYQAIARGHGYDQGLCHNAKAPFLPWHRAYIYHFEKNLTDGLRFKRKDDTLVITLPWWDWTMIDPNKDTPDGLPKVFEADTYKDPTEQGKSKPNPLKAAKSLYRILGLGATGDEQYTKRYPNQFASASATIVSMTKRAMARNDFERFNDTRGVENPHNAIHGLVGGMGDPLLPGGSGDMGSTTTASFDPIFWVHHAFVDKLWFDWQKEHPNATLPVDIQGLAMYGGIAIEKTMDSERDLMVGYSIQPMSASGDSIQTEDSPEESTLPPTVQLDLGRFQRPDGALKQVTLHLHGLRPPTLSCELRIFLNQQDASESTPRENNPNFAGNLCFFGHGRCFGAPGHCSPEKAVRDAYDLRSPHHFEPKNYHIEITEAVQAALKGLRKNASRKVALSFVVVDMSGEQISPEELEVESVSFTIE